jgi:hypothetical protein
MPRLRLFALATLAQLSAAPAAAQQFWATSMGEMLPCRQLIHVATDLGNTIVYWPARNYPRAGEEVAGDFQRVGWQTLIGTDGRAVRTYVVAVKISGAALDARVRACILAHARSAVRD